MSKQLDIHQTVTDTIVAAIERGVGEWKMPWHQGHGLSFIPANIEGHSYHGVNCIHLFCCALNKHYGTNTWGSFRQLQEAGLQVRKGEKASLVVFYKSITVEPDAEREDDDGTRRVLKHYSVFNVEQCEGWVPKEAPPPAPAFDRLEHVERVFGATGATVVVGGDRASYVRDADLIKMPDVGLFHGDVEQRREAFYATLAHEMIHWTGAPHRLNREKGKTFGDAVYAFEELIADAGSAMACAELGISPVVRQEHAEYIGHWLKHLKEDKKAIFRAAARASEAVRYITSFSESGGRHAQAA